MNEKEFSDKYIAEKPMFQAWGDLVLSEILKKLPADFHQYIKIEQIRVKDLDSILNKAFVIKNRKYDEITDKVGIRFVVLLTDHISIIKQAIDDEVDLWDASEDRELEDWRRTNTPDSFGYQSVHYVLYAKKNISHGDITIKKGAPCEVQIRTLLQHAYAEMAHDQTYKTERAIPREVYRHLAKSMALMETTDEILSIANQCILDSDKVINDWKYLISKLAKELLTSVSSHGTDYILNQLREVIIDIDKYKKHSLDDFERYVKENQEYIEEIKSRSQISIGFREETILVVFYFITLYPRQIKRIPLFDEEIVMRHAYSILGKTYNDIS